MGGFTSDNFALGIIIGYEKGNPEGLEYLNDAKLKIFKIGIFGRKYYQIASKFSVFLEGNISYDTATIEYESFSYYNNPTTIEENKYNGYAISISPGISYFLNKHFALEANWGILQYSSSKLEEEDAESVDTFTIGLDFEDLSFALLYKF